MRATLVGGALTALVGFLGLAVRLLLDRRVWLDSVVLHPARSVVLLLSNHDILLEGTNMTAWLFVATLGVFFTLGCLSTGAWLLGGHDEGSSIRRTLVSAFLLELVSTIYEVAV